MAFSKEEQNVGLVIKATHAKEEDIIFFQELLKNRSNIFFLYDSYDKTVFNSLIKNIDVYVSLHRAEGFGLVMAEAMILGTPVIATNWSANTEFINDDVSCMVRAEVVPLKENVPPITKVTIGRSRMRKRLHNGCIDFILIHHSKKKRFGRRENTF